MGRRLERTLPAAASPLRPHVEDVAVPGPAPALDALTPPGPPAPAAARAPDPGTSIVPDSESSEVPKYLTLERKETRLRSEQVSALGELARQLSARRRHRGERITENTLVRIAVDVLLDQAHELQGDTEAELRESVTSVLPKSGTSDA